MTLAVQKEALRRAEQSEARYKALVEQATDALFVFNLDGRFVEVNQQACDSLGYTSEELLHMGIADVAPGHDLAGRRKVWAEIEPGKKYSIITTHRRKDGSTFPVEIHLAGLLVDNEKLMMALVSDTTEQHHTLAALQKSERHLREAQSIAHIGSWDFDLLTNRITWTEELYRIYGVDPETFTPGIDTLINLIHPDDRIAMQSWIASCMSGHKPPALQFRCVWPDGRIRYIEGQGELILNKNGEPIYMSGTGQDITERKNIESKIKNLAFYDDLTKLPNRRLLNDRLAQAISASKRSHHYCALIFLDLDNFKPLNDKHGHGVGDLLLMEAANRINGCVREVDTVARFGGDEFVVVLSELNVDKAISTTQVSAVAEKIRVVLAEPYALIIQNNDISQTTIEHRCTSSIGVVLFSNHEANPEDILRQADMAMYQAKEAGRNQVQFVDVKI